MSGFNVMTASAAAKPQLLPNSRRHSRHAAQQYASPASRLGSRSENSVRRSFLVEIRASNVLRK
jgi:hypothetical protein